MRFPTLSLLFALSLGSASAEESLTKRAHNQTCGIEDIHNAKLVDCKELLENDDIWNNAIDGEYGTDNPNHSNSVIAGHKKCYLFHRYGPGWPNDPLNVDQIRTEAWTLLDCTNGKKLNGKASYGEGLQSHDLCIGGEEDDGEECLGNKHPLPLY